LILLVQKKNSEVSSTKNKKSKKYALRFFVSHAKDFRNRVSIYETLTSIASELCITKIPNISKSFLTQDRDKSYSIDCKGPILEYFMKKCNFIDEKNIYCNDVHEIEKFFGVEAARNVIKNEIDKIYQSYNIKIDSRYLTMLADFMTIDGVYRGLSRNTADLYSSSIWQNVSFETAVNFLKKSALRNDEDNQNNSSSNLVFGQVMKGGTNSFDVLYNLDY